MKIIFIRHGETNGNSQGRYIGLTDEELSEKGRNEIILKKHKYPKADRVISSPMKRCVETAEIIYGQAYEIYDDLKECNFGDFENKNFEELKNDEYYIKWLESNGNLPFPNGEGHLEFCIRCCNCFEKIISGNKANSVAFVVHGGTIMAILEKFYFEKTAFYQWQIKNGEYIEFEITRNGKGFYLKYTDF